MASILPWGKLIPEVVNEVDLTPKRLCWFAPGISMLIKMSEFETSRTATLDVDQMADFAAWYAEVPGMYHYAFRKTVLTIIPHPWLRIIGMTALSP